MRFATDNILSLSAVVADTASEVLDLDTIVHCSVQLSWTSTTAAGTIHFEVSNNGTSWTSLDSATVNNNSGTDMFVLQNNPYKYARINVDYTSGSITTITATYHGKGY